MAYARIPARVWHALRPLGDDARLLALYVRSCSHRNRVGLYRLEPLYVAADLEWTEDRVHAALRELQEADEIAWDAQARVVLVPDVLMVDPLVNDVVAKSALSDLDAVPDTELFRQLLEQVERARSAAEDAGKKSEQYGMIEAALRARLGLPVGAPLHSEAHPTPNHSGNGKPNCSGNGFSPSQAYPSLSSPALSHGEREVSHAGEARAGGDAGRAWAALEDIVLQRWHRGHERIRAGNTDVGMGAEKLNVAQLVHHHGVEDTIRAVTIAPEVFEWEGPTSLRWFTSKQHGAANFNTALGEWHKRAVGA